MTSLGRERLLLAVILIGLAAALLWQAWTTGVAVDGPSHLLSAHLYWQGADRLQPGDMPPLIKLMAGWVPGFFHPPVPYDHPVWNTQHEWFISMEMMERMTGPQIQRLYFFSRLPLLIFPLLTAVLVWHWGRQLFGCWVGVWLALLYALEPTALAHGALFKNDLAATFTYFFFWYRAWRFWREPRLRHVFYFAGALLLALMSKMSMLFLLGVAPVILVLRYVTLPGKRLHAMALALVVLLVVPYVGVVAAYQFDTRRLPATELAAHWADPSLPRAFLGAAQVFRVLPVPKRMWEGVVSLFQADRAGNMIYLLGNIYRDGHPLYFVIALALKAPIPLQVLALCGAVMVAMRLRRRQLQTADVFWLLPGALYVALASLSTLQLGVRLVLPALPFGVLLCGPPVAAWIRDRRIALVAGLVTWLGVRSAGVYPHGISFFNSWAGGPDHGLRYLADSNVDWGQDLPALARFVASRGIPKMRLFYFGNDNPHDYFREDQIEVLPPPWGPEMAKGAVYQPEPGFYAVSANLIPGHMFEPQYRDYYRAFQALEPVAKAGYSIYIYYVP